VADVAPTLSVQALKERGMPYAFYTAMPEKRAELDKAGVPIAGTLEDLVKSVDVMLDATSAGVGAKNKELYAKYGVKEGASPEA
jgi:glyceraldehyde-3-phosphate dehydrogenase (NAD(P))